MKFEEMWPRGFKGVNRCTDVQWMEKLTFEPKGSGELKIRMCGWQTTLSKTD